MLAIGIILIVVGAGGGALVGYLAAQSSQAVTLTAAGVSVGVLPITLFASGAVAMLLVWLGFRMGAVGARHKRATRRELKERRREVKELRATTGPGSKTSTTGMTGPTTGSTPTRPTDSAPPTSAGGRQA